MPFEIKGGFGSMPEEEKRELAFAMAGTIYAELLGGNTMEFIRLTAAIIRYEAQGKEDELLGNPAKALAANVPVAEFDSLIRTLIKDMRAMCEALDAIAVAHMQTTLRNVDAARAKYQTREAESGLSPEDLNEGGV